MTLTRVPEWLARLRAWLLRRLTRTPRPLPARRRSNIPKTAAVNREEEGAFFYLRDVLDRLDQCQSLLRKLKTVAPDAYDYHRRVGAKILPTGSGIYTDKIWPEFLEARPANGMSLFFQPKNSKFVPMLFFFEKREDPVYVQRSRFDIYECSVVFFLKAKAMGVCFHIALDGDGNGSLMRERGQIRQQLPKRRELIRTGWRIPPDLRMFYKGRNDAAKEMTLEEYAVSYFCATANYAMMPASDELLVRCAKGGITAAMNVSTKRTPYFFSDRQTTLAVDGKRKRIFHIVRQHIRVLRDGKTSQVCEHYRGERDFTWGGHKIVISAPKRQTIVEMPLAGKRYEPGEEIPADGIGAAELGDTIVEILEDARRPAESASSQNASSKSTGAPSGLSTQPG
jgi:hypothetical protein